MVNCFSGERISLSVAARPSTSPGATTCPQSEAMTACASSLSLSATARIGLRKTIAERSLLGKKNWPVPAICVMRLIEVSTCISR